MITTTFKRLYDARACKKRYKHLARKLGGIKSYGRGTPITLLQILDANGIDDAMWALRACDINADGERLLRLWACWCAERALHREREAGREPDARSWAAVEVSRRYANGEATEEGLGAAWEAAWEAWDARVVRVAWEVWEEWAVREAMEAAARAAVRAADLAAFPAAQMAVWAAGAAVRAAVASREAERSLQAAELRRMLAGEEG